MNRGYYSLNRVPRTITENEQENGTRTTYIGTETYISLVDQDEAPYSGNLAEIEIKALCSNRDLPLLIPQGNSNDTDFTFDSNLPVNKIKFLHGPTSPNCEHLSNSLWKIINHVSLNYLTLQDDQGEKTGEIIRNILELYAVSDIQKKYIKGLKAIKIVPDTQRFNKNGMFTFLNGLAVDILFDESSSGSDYFLLGMILDRFFKYSAPVNTFTKTTVKSLKRGKVVEWPARTGTFQMI